MMDITTLSEIIRLTDAVYESDKLNLELDPISFEGAFKEIKDELNPKQYIRFVCNNPHSKWQTALDTQLQKINDGKAATVLKLKQDGISAKVTVVDMTQIDDHEDQMALQNVISNTMIKMRVAKLERELKAKTADAKKMRAGIDKIKDAADKAKAGLGSRKVNALKEIIEKAAENVK